MKKRDDEEDSRFKNPLKERIIYEKRKMYEELILEGRSLNETASDDDCNSCFGEYDNST